jgi:hypothetical protein
MNARRLVLAATSSLALFLGCPLLAASAALADETCPNAASRQGPSAALPDCRAYEQVTPANKGDAQDMFPSRSLSSTPDTGFVAEDGNHLLLNTAAPLAGGDAYLSSYVFLRGAGGWTTTSLSPGPGLHGLLAEVFNPEDLSQVGVNDTQYNLLPGLAGRIEADYIGQPGGPYTTIATLPFEEEPRIMGASADLSHVVLQSVNHELAPGDTGQDSHTTALYEWVGGQMRLVNIAPNGTLLACGGELGLGEYYAGGTQNAVSSDGSKIFFTAPRPESQGQGAGCWNPASTPQENPPQLYMRLDGATTVDVSAPNAGVSDPTGLHPAIYAGASVDGSKVFFLSEAELTADDTTHALELYEYNTEAPAGERLVRVSSGEAGTAEGNVDFVGATSSDGSTVYFSAFGRLAAGASALKEEGMGDFVNLYRYDTATRTTSYITKIQANDYPAQEADSPNWYIGYIAGNGGQPYERALDAQTSWYTTGNGRYLLFSSELPLTGYDNESPGVDECPGLEANGFAVTRCAELFRYSAADGSVVCVSCAGGAPVDNARFSRNFFSSVSVGSPRPISEDGSYVFFDTASALVPQTTGGKVHVYGWHDGKISLISSPNDPANAYFLGSSANGSDVFFGTHAQLVPQDTDLLGDVYDARIDGGFVGVTPPLCTGSGCQGVPGAPPIFATPASVTFAGLGDFEPSSPTVIKAKPKTVKCPKGKTRNKKGKCVRTKTKKRAKRASSDRRTRS